MAEDKMRRMCWADYQATQHEGWSEVGENIYGQPEQLNGCYNIQALGDKGLGGKREEKTRHTLKRKQKPKPWASMQYLVASKMSVLEPNGLCGQFWLFPSKLLPVTWAGHVT